MIRNNSRRDIVPCGSCNYCLEGKRTSWSFRLNQELRVSTSASFLTMTYDDEKIKYSDTGEQTLSKIDVQLFKKRIRKEQSQITQDKIRYYTVGEYGTKTSRPHYHSIMFNLHPAVLNSLPRIWTHGHIHAGDVTEASIHYVTKYVINRHGHDYDNRTPPFALMSRKPGIGSNYLQTHMQWHRADKRSYTQVNGILGPLPRFYKEKIFSPLERKIMAAHAVEQSDSDYAAELHRLRRYHSDPAAYYDECIASQHNRVTNKINQLDKF